jgi:hypothetical protein
MTRRIEPSTTPTGVKAQHTVPRCFLQQFALDPTVPPDKQKIVCFHKAKRACEERRITSVSVGYAVRPAYGAEVVLPRIRHGGPEGGT